MGREDLVGALLEGGPERCRRLAGGLVGFAGAFFGKARSSAGVGGRWSGESCYLDAGALAMVFFAAMKAGPGGAAVEAGPGGAAVDAGPGGSAVDAGPGGSAVEAGPGGAAVDAGPGDAAVARRGTPARGARR